MQLPSCNPASLPNTLVLTEGHNLLPLEDCEKGMSAGFRHPVQPLVPGQHERLWGSVLTCYMKVERSKTIQRERQEEDG